MFHVLAGAGTGGGFDPSLIIMIVVMIAMVYFMMIRPESKRKKEAEATRESIKNGHKVTTIGGVVGIVVDVKTDTFVMETSADRVRIEFTKWAISTNDTVEEEKKAAAKKAEEDRAKARAKKKAENNEK